MGSGEAHPFDARVELLVVVLIVGHRDRGGPGDGISTRGIGYVRSGTVAPTGKADYVQQCVTLFSKRKAPNAGSQQGHNRVQGMPKAGRARDGTLGYARLHAGDPATMRRRHWHRLASRPTKHPRKYGLHGQPPSSSSAMGLCTHKTPQNATKCHKMARAPSSVGGCARCIRCCIRRRCRPGGRGRPDC